MQKHQHQDSITPSLRLSVHFFLAGIKFDDCLLVGNGLDLVASRDAHQHCFERLLIQRKPIRHSTAGGNFQVFAGELRATGPVSDGAARPSNVTRDTRHAIGPVLERCAQAVPKKATNAWAGLLFKEQAAPSACQTSACPGASRTAVSASRSAAVKSPCPASRRES